VIFICVHTSLWNLMCVVWVFFVGFVVVVVVVVVVVLFCLLLFFDCLFVLW